MKGWLTCLRGDGTRKLLIALVGGWLLAAASGCAPVHQNYARSALSEGRLNDATSEIQLALARHPDDPQVRHLAAQIYTASGAHFYQLKDLDAATRDFHQAIQYDPNYGAAYDYLGQMAFARADWANAISYGTQGAQLQNRAVPVYVDKAQEKMRAASGLAAPQSGAN
jgi:tetratricopeptide (TPR) repeat protein